MSIIGAMEKSRSNMLLSLLFHTRGPHPEGVGPPSAAGSYRIFLFFSKS